MTAEWFPKKKSIRPEVTLVMTPKMFPRLSCLPTKRVPNKEIIAPMVEKTPSGKAPDFIVENSSDKGTPNCISPL